VAKQVEVGRVKQTAQLSPTAPGKLAPEIPENRKGVSPEYFIHIFSSSMSFCSVTLTLTLV
jgi:hypothetical protein